MITSTSNEQVKNIIQLKEKAKVRRQKKLFVVEGIKMFREIPKDKLVSVFVSEKFEKENEELLSHTDYILLSDSVFKKISDTVTPQGILAVVKQNEFTVEDIIERRDKERSCIVVLDRLQDPGNLGTIVRTGEGAGITGIVMSNDSVDLYNPKVIRSTMGSVFRVPVAVVPDLQDAIKKMKQNGIETYAAHLNGMEYQKGAFGKDIALLIGNEAKGLSDEVSVMADKLIKIPMEGKVESLNAAVATAILMYEARR
ncbi:TrmH family RNA methyltransferase [Eubacterium sp.]